MRKLAIVCCLMILGSAIPAQAITFNFAFSNAANGGGEVTGTISGLEDNATRAATSVIITSNEAGFGAGEYVSPLAEIHGFNTFTVANGALTHFDFNVLGSWNQFPYATCCSLFLQSSPFDGSIAAGLTDSPSTVHYATVPFTTTVVPEPPPPIPLPAPLLMLASALATLGGLSRLGQRKAPTAAV